MPPQFKNMNELVDYLCQLELRVNQLETEKRDILPVQAPVDDNIMRKYISRLLPQTNLFSPNFFKRAFAVWGHFFVANLMIGIVFGIFYACLMMTLFSSLLRNIQK